MEHKFQIKNITLKLHIHEIKQNVLLQLKDSFKVFIQLIELMLRLHTIRRKVSPKKRSFLSLNIKTF